MSHLALRRDPKLLQADVKSLLMALVRCAYRDLELGVEDGVWLIPYKGKVTPVPAYKGLIKRATETGSVLDVKPYPIYQGDTVEVRYGLDEDLIHKPVFGEQRGPSSAPPSSLSCRTAASAFTSCIETKLKKFATAAPRGRPRPYGALAGVGGTDVPQDRY